MILEDTRFTPLYTIPQVPVHLTPTTHLRQSVQKSTHCHYINPITHSISRCLTVSSFQPRPAPIEEKNGYIRGGCGSVVDFFLSSTFRFSAGGVPSCSRPMFSSVTSTRRMLSVSCLPSHIQVSSLHTLSLFGSRPGDDYFACDFSPSILVYIFGGFCYLAMSHTSIYGHWMAQESTITSDA